MSAAEWAVTRRIRISGRIACDLTLGPGGAVCEWVGGRPRYRAERDELLSEVALRMGGTIMLVEV
jgi:hypothetical protein